MAFMRHNNNGRRHNNNHSNNRHRPHSHNPNNGQQGQRRHVNRVNQVFESNGPEGRVRGTAAQIVEKYMGLARDAQASGDRVLSMNYFQHAEHYQRLLTEITEENAAFERDRDAQRAAQSAQPEISATDAQTGFVDANAPQPGDEQPREQREPREPRQYQDRGDRPQREERRFDNRGPRPPREPRQQQQPRQEDDSDLNALPGFLQVPITTSAPEGPVVETAAKPRTPRPRRVVTAAADTAEE